MAIDFSQVKTITIPEGSVTKITDSNGNTLWQGAGWYTIWEGNKKISTEDQTSTFLFGNVPYSDELKLRISFSEINAYNTWGSGTAKYWPSDRVSPVICESSSFIRQQNILVRAEFDLSDTRKYCYASLYYYKDTGKIDGYSGSSNGMDNGAKAYIVITKIEAYY